MKLIAITFSVILLLGIILLSVKVPPKLNCQEVIVLAIGGCDGNGVCGVVIGNEQGQIKKDKLPYPIAGIAQELCE